MRLFCLFLVFILCSCSPKPSPVLPADSSPDELLKLYEATAQRQYLEQAIREAHQVEANIQSARFLNKLFHYSGIAEFKDEAQKIMQEFNGNDLATSSELQLLKTELKQDPVHITIVGSKRDRKAKELYQVALTYPGDYIRVEWYDAKEGRLYNHDVDYPQLSRAAAFSCVNSACSLPVYDARELKQNLIEL